MRKSAWKNQLHHPTNQKNQDGYKKKSDDISRRNVKRVYRDKPRSYFEFKNEKERKCRKN
jgi:hypothetical protein